MDSNKIKIAAFTIKKTFHEKKMELDKIILFGSSADVIKKENNDIDLIVISRNFRKKSYDKRIFALKNLNRDIVKKTDKPVDILYYSDEEWNEDSSLIIREAKKTGKVIYLSRSCGEH